MSRGDLPGILAGFAIVFVGLWAFATWASPCSPPIERTSYIGESLTAPSAAVTAPGSVTDNPYAIEGCDFFVSDLSRWIGIVGVLVLLVVGYITAVRIGNDRKAWRGIAAVIAGILCFALVSAS